MFAGKINLVFVTMVKSVILDMLKNYAIVKIAMFLNVKNNIQKCANI